MPETEHDDRLRQALGYSALASKTYNILRRADINTLEDLNKWTYAELIQLRGFGQSSLRCAIDALAWAKERGWVG